MTTFSQEVREYVNLSAQIGKQQAKVNAMRFQAKKRLEPIMAKIATSERFLADLESKRKEIALSREAIAAAIKAFDDFESDMNEVTVPANLTTPES